MEGNFCKIVSLIDYSDISLQAADEAAMIASKFGSELHLLHISPQLDASRLYIPKAFFYDVEENGEEAYYENIGQLQKIKLDLLKRYGVSAICFEERGGFVEGVKKHVENSQINLVVVGSKKKTWIAELFSQSKARSIIRALDCEVLCVNAESGSKKLKKIVLPVGKFIPKKRIRLAYVLAKKFTARIHLIALNKQGDNLSDEGAKTLIASYQYLKDVTNIPIECNTLQGKNLAEAAMDYAKVIGADLILINEGAESELKGKILSKWGGNIVHHSSVPVMSVHAINEEVNKKQDRA
jgi:nucleotide-binding universal stress UspA family protein